MLGLDLGANYNYANPYRTNWNYLHNLTELQMKALKEMEWNKSPKYIHTGLWGVPRASFSKEVVEGSVERFIDDLNNKIMEL